MNTEELKRLAEPLASPNGSDSNASWWDAFHRAANPAAVLELIRQRDELVEALKDAREMVSDWAGYASPYFQEKHDIDGDLKKLDDAIARMEG